MDLLDTRSRISHRRPRVWRRLAIAITLTVIAANTSLVSASASSGDPYHPTYAYNLATWDGQICMTPISAINGAPVVDGYCPFPMWTLTSPFANPHPIADRDPYSANKCLDTSYGQLVAGAQIVIGVCTSAMHQQWMVAPTNPKSYLYASQIINWAAPSMCVTRNSQLSVDGTRGYSLQPCTGINGSVWVDPNQVFQVAY